MDYKSIIDSKGIKQSWIAKQLGVTRAMVNLYIKGKTGMAPEKVRKMNQLLGIE
ncbi:helix-turn-helix domain-containing protein [Paenibacillus ferrarius]|uniref:helix-turn-helix domain-containing protein n=1 Tax=Paenibacillus ferrarius TaxID=1469647 RepID=UPI00117D229F|nr:helix-turn-helix transcriptional regulator [Paenibacillus ferrarius]